MVASTSADRAGPKSVSTPERATILAMISSEITDYGFGLAAMLDVPGADPIMVYEPHHPEAYDL